MRSSVYKCLGATIIGFLSFLGTFGHAVAANPIDQTQRSYQAKWIWCTVAQPKPFQFVRFRKTVELSSIPPRATMYITADTFYRLWINEQLVMHGPARSSRGKATVDPLDVGRYLVQGKNTLMIEAFHGECPFETLSQSPGLLCELVVHDGKKEAVVAASDASWEAAEITAWGRDSLRFSYQRGWMEQFDERKVLQEKWQPAIVLGNVGMAPWKKVELRDIPLPAPLLFVRPTKVLAVHRGDGFVGNIDPVERFELPRPQWDQQSQWFRRLETERLKTDTAAAQNPTGVTANGSGDTILQGNRASISYDLGLGYVGFLDFEVTGHDGQILEVVWNERLSDGNAVRPRAQTGNNAIRYTLREGRQRFLAFMPQFARFVRVVQHGDGQIALHRCGLTEFRFNAEAKGGFRCSDEQINRIYDAAARTAMLVTLDAYMDCPHRERNAMYSVEAYWMEKAVYPMFGDTSVSRRSVIYGADGVEDPERAGPPGLIQVAYPMHLNKFNCVIPTGPLFWVLHTGLYERCSGDKELIRSMIPVMRRNLAVFDGWCNSDGLLESIPSWMFFDYADIRTDGVSIALNAIYAKALDEAARLEHLAGDVTKADTYTKHAQQVRDAINRHCTGDTFYPDVLFRNDKKALTPSPQACETTQYYATWCNVPPPERLRHIWQALRDDFVPTPLKKIQPIRGLTRAGLYPFEERLETAAKLGDHAAVLRDTKAMFLPMVDSAPGTLWEDPMATIALCHSIGCGISGILTEEMLGIRLGLPLMITPHSGGSLQWCKGYITTPKGRVEVDWECQKDRYQLRASLPKGVSAEVELPPEAEAVWRSAPSTTPWHKKLTIHDNAVFVVKPGVVEIR